MNPHRTGLDPVLVISTVHGPGHGAETVLENLLRVWGQRHPLILIAPRDAQVLEVAAASGIASFHLDTRRDTLWQNVRALWRLRAILPRAAVVHAWHPRGFDLAWLLGRLRNCPAAGTLHDHARAYYFGRWRRHLIRFCANRFVEVVAVSQATVAVAQTCGLEGPFAVVLNGLTDSPPSPDPRPKSIGFLGMNAPAKGFATIQAWIEATGDLDWTWCLYGNLAPELAIAAESLVRRYPNRVHLRGRMDAAAIFAEIGILVHASTAFETLGMVLLEAGRAAIPLVAADIGGTAEAVIDGVNGFLFDPGEPAQGLAPLRRLMTDEALRRRLGQAGRRQFEAQFRAERMADEYAAFWQQIRQGKAG